MGLIFSAVMGSETKLRAFLNALSQDSAPGGAALVDEVAPMAEWAKALTFRSVVQSKTLKRCI